MKNKNKLIIFISLIMLIFFSGCYNKHITVDMGINNISKTYYSDTNPIIVNCMKQKVEDDLVNHCLNYDMYCGGGHYKSDMKITTYEEVKEKFEYQYNNCLQEDFIEITYYNIISYSCSEIKEFIAINYYPDIPLYQYNIKKVNYENKNATYIYNLSSSNLIRSEKFKEHYINNCIIKEK